MKLSNKFARYLKKTEKKLFLIQSRIYVFIAVFMGPVLGWTPVEVPILWAALNRAS